MILEAKVKCLVLDSVYHSGDVLLLYKHLETAAYLCSRP